MRKLWLLAAAASLLLVARAPQASAQDASVVATCGSITLSPGYGVAPVVMNTSGQLCTTGSGGSGGAVTIADGADVTQGAKADSACGTATGTCTEIQLLKYLNTQLGTAIPAGTNTIGNTGGLETPGSAVTGGANRMAGSDGTNARDIATSTTGVLDSPRAGTANRVVTKTSIASNTSTTVCPTATAPISTELFFTTAGVGISLAGGTLTTATIGTTATTTPDLSFATANTLYTLPVPPTNIITAYGAAGIVVCIQNIRQ